MGGEEVEMRGLCLWLDGWTFSEEFRQYYG